MVTQPGDPKNKSKPAYKKYCTYCHKNNHGVSNWYQKQRDEEYQKYRNPRPRTPQQPFVQYFRSKPSNSQDNRTENKTDYSSKDNDRSRYSQNYSYHNDRYRKNDKYQSNSRDYSQNNYRSNSRQRYYNRSQNPYSSRSRFDTFINSSASIPEPMKPFDGLYHSYTPEEYLQQVEARLTFAIGEELQNNPVKY